MKVSFLKDIAVDCVDKHEEVYSRSFIKGYIIEVSQIQDNDKFSNLLLENGETLVDIPKNSYKLL